MKTVSKLYHMVQSFNGGGLPMSTPVRQAVKTQLSFCHYYNIERCRSCDWIERGYDEQLAAKEQLIRTALAAFSPFALEPSVRSALEGFRNRAKLAVTGTLEEPIVGLVGSE